MLERLKGYISPGSEEEALVKAIDFDALPRHVAVIMDGNGRWAKKRNLPRVEGHRAGSKSVREIVETSARLGLEYLTLYAFSKENWKRPKHEITTLWKLLEDYLLRQDHVLVENNIRLHTIGQLDDLPRSVQKELARVRQLTQNNTGLKTILALNYGGRAEIIDTFKKLAADNHFDISKLTEEKFSSRLYTAGIPDPDLLIRTSGELRISNFLLWQIAYTEIWITQELWPDFRKRHFLKAIVDYQRRERRFGDIHPQAQRFLQNGIQVPLNSPAADVDE